MPESPSFLKDGLSGAPWNPKGERSCARRSSVVARRVLFADRVGDRSIFDIPLVGAPLVASAILVTSEGLVMPGRLAFPPSGSDQPQVERILVRGP